MCVLLSFYMFCVEARFVMMASVMLTARLVIMAAVMAVRAIRHLVF